MKTDSELAQALIKEYGTQIEDNMEIILNRISMVIAAFKFAGNQGDNPLCQLNRFFEEHDK